MLMHVINLTSLIGLYAHELLMRFSKLNNDAPLDNFPSGGGGGGGDSNVKMTDCYFDTQRRHWSPISFASWKCVRLLKEPEEKGRIPFCVLNVKMSTCMSFIARRNASVILPLTLMPLVKLVTSTVLQ